jgi:SAM-dependent methyltransferase
MEPETRTVIPSREPAALRKWLRARLLERTLRRIPRDEQVLDLCCGYGFYFSINPRASGIDGDPRAVAAMRQKGYDVHLGNVLDTLPYADHRFRWVVAHDVLEHFAFDELERLIPEVQRVLAPGGRFLIIVPNRKGYDFGVRIGIGHKLFVTGQEVETLSRGRFELEARYPEPLPRWLGRFFTHNKEVFLLRKPDPGQTLW